MGARSSQSRGPGLNKTDGHLLEYFRQNFGAGGGGTNAPAGEGLTATGGVISDYTDPGPGAVYRAHIFTSSGTFDVTASGDFGDTVEYLVVAGGGGGGQQSGGGGGAGGLRTNVSGVQTDDSTPLTGSPFPVNPGSFPAPFSVTVGAGGQGSLKDPSNPAGPGSGYRGTPSSFGPITATGGGGGLNNNTYGPGYPSLPQITGGSGGGGGCAAAPNSRPGALGNTPPFSPIQGHPGGSGGYDGGPGRNDYGGGGGGAGRAGHNAGTTPDGTGGPGPVPATGGDGGIGVQVLIAGPPTSDQPVGTPGPSGTGWFAGGGGGGNHPAGTASSGGAGGGGTGGVGPSDNAGRGTYATGGGGGGTGEYNLTGGSGGSGIVVVRYQIGSIETQKATGGSVSFYNGKTIHTFKTSGEFTNATASPLTCEYIAIAGGGAGGCGDGDEGGGGGGAGGIRSNVSPFPFSATPMAAVGSGSPNKLTITVGAGGAGKFGTGINGGEGSDTTIVGTGINITARRGGFGGGTNSPGGSGGSGGGSRGAGGNVPGGSASPPGQGYDGGLAEWHYPGSGGGGAGSIGDTGNNDPDSGKGGTGYQLHPTFTNPASITALGFPGSSGSYWVAGGGAGGQGQSGGGYGGGGGGPYASPYAGAGKAGHSGASDGGDAEANSGSGGGGGEHNPGVNKYSGSGGSGLVLIAYPS